MALHPPGILSSFRPHISANYLPPIVLRKKWANNKRFKSNIKNKRRVLNKKYHYNIKKLSTIKWVDQEALVRGIIIHIIFCVS